MTLLVTEYALRDRRRGIIGWSLGSRCTSP